MPTPSPPGRDAGSSARLQVFLSYSRTDGTFAAELLAALELLGFDAYLDKEDIAPGEPWEERLGGLIRLADTVVFIISSASLASAHCAWEVEETARAGKRLVPVMLAQVPNTDVPDRLRKLNYVFFSDGQSFSKSLGDLARALRADAGWIREHTRYGELAIRWKERNESTALLLRGTDLDDAKRWVVAQPAEAPEVSASQQVYIEASSRAADEELAAKAKLRVRTQVGLAVAAVVLAALAAASLCLWRAAERANALLDATNARLERRLALRTAPRGYEPYDVPAGWFQVATRYAGAVGFVEKRSEPNRLTASGVLVDARLLSPGWADGPVFVTATYVVAKDRAVSTSALPPAEAQIVMLGPKNERRTARLGAILWQSESLGVSVSTIEDPLPADVIVIRAANAAPPALSGLERLSSAEVDALFDDKDMLKQQKAYRPIVFVGNLQGREEVAISISHLLGVTSGRSGSPRGGLTRDIAPAPVAAQVQPDLVYTHGTLPGGGGSPIFDAETGDLIGIHLMSYPCAQSEVKRAQSEVKRCTAAGTSFPSLLAGIRGQ